MSTKRKLNISKILGYHGTHTVDSTHTFSVMCFGCKLKMCVCPSYLFKQLGVQSDVLWQKTIFDTQDCGLMSLTVILLWAPRVVKHPSQCFIRVLFAILAFWLLVCLIHRVRLRRAVCFYSLNRLPSSRVALLPRLKTPAGGHTLVAMATFIGVIYFPQEH